jgi:hypothetical protein
VANPSSCPNEEGGVGCRSMRNVALICHNLPMCGRYRLSRRKQIIEEHFDSISGEEDWRPRYNIAPMPKVSSRQFGSGRVSLSRGSGERIRAQGKRLDDSDVSRNSDTVQVEAGGADIFDPAT